MITSGSVIAPRSVRDGHRIVFGGTDFGRGGRRQPDHRRAGGAGQVRFAVLQPAVVEQHPPAGQHGLALAGLRGLRGATGGAATAGPSQAPSWAISAPAAARVGRSEIDADLVGEERQHPQIGGGVGRAARARTGEAGPPS